MTKLSAGDKAPDFKGFNENGATISLKDFKGKKLILFFYPKDNTPTCTTEACNLRDNYDLLVQKGYALIGVSPDTEKSHQKYIKKHSLPFPLLADTDKKIIMDYGLWVEKSMYGRRFMGVARTTFIINEKGIIETIFEKVESKRHAEQILAYIDIERNKASQKL